MGLSIYDEKIPYNARNQFQPSDSTAIKTLGNATDAPHRVDAILVSNNDSIAHVIVVGLNVAATDTMVGSCSVPAGQGFAGTPALDILAAAFGTTVSGVVIVTGGYIRVQLEVAMNTAKTIELLALGGLL